MPFEYEIGHDKVGGYSSGEEINKFVNSASSVVKINSFINAVTAYGDNVNYSSKNISTLSFSPVDNYFVKVAAYMDNDGRNYIHTIVKITDISKEQFGFCEELKQFGYPLRDNFGDNFWQKFKFSLLLALSNERVPYFVITNEGEKIVNGIKSAFAAFNNAVTKRVICVDAVGSIPNIKADVIVCRSFSKDDFDAFMQEINSLDEKVVLKIAGGRAHCQVNIKKPSYCSSVLSYMVSKAPNISNIIDEFIQASLKADKYCNLYNNNSEFYNMAAYIMLKDRHSQHIAKISASQQEIDAIERILNSGGRL